MKTLVSIISICILSNISFGQRPKLLNKKNTIADFKKATLIVNPSLKPEFNDLNKEFNQTVQLALNKYWTLSKVKYDEKASIRDIGANTFSGRNGQKYVWRPMYMNSLGFNYNPCFDIFEKGDEIYGIDKTPHMMSIKAYMFIMIYCAELKKIEKMGETNYNLQVDSIEKINKYNIIIPKENITSGRLSENSFKSNLKKYELLDSEEIYKRLKEQTNTENNALLFIGRSDYEFHLSLMDMKSGELLYTSSVYRGTFKQGADFNDELINKLLEKISQH